MENFFLLFFTSFIWTALQAVNYIDQQSWGGICINGTRQSPRDIPSINSDSLIKCPSNQSVTFI